MADQGTGITITFDSSYFASILSMNGPNIERDSIEVTTFATTGGREFVPSDVYDPGSVEAEILLAPGTSPNVVGGAAETCTVTFSNADASTWAATGFMTAINPTAVLNDRVKANCTIKLSGDVTITL